MKLPAALLAVLLATACANAATTVLYETGWESSEVDHAWAAGVVASQNSWQNFGGPDSNPARHSVVIAGTADAAPFGTPIPASTGDQFHRFRASSSTTNVNVQYAWPDLTTPFASRLPGFNTLICSLDLFVPSAEANDRSLYGLIGYDGFTEHTSVLIQPNGALIGLFTEGNLNVVSPATAYPFDAWFNLSVSQNFETGEVIVKVDGTAVPGMTIINPILVGANFTDMDLYCQNSMSSPNPRVIFSDNYRVTIESAARPILFITRPDPTLPIFDQTWRLSWSADYADWILESTPDIAALGWTNEGAIPGDPVDGMVSVDLFDSPPQMFYRLRAP